MPSPEPEVAIVGGGIAGLALALHLHAASIPCRVYEAASTIAEVGVGITLLPHAMREMALLGLDAAVIPIGIQTQRSQFFNRFGQLLLSEPRGLAAGYPLPEVSIHRGRLHGLLYRAVVERLGAAAIATDYRCIGTEQDEAGVTLHFASATGEARPSRRASVVIACDGVNSAIRRQFYPDEKMVFSGVNTWRGVTRRPPIIDGCTYLRIGSFRTGNIIIYPIADGVEGTGDQLVNWVAQIPAVDAGQNDWNKKADAADFGSFFGDWVFDWLDVPALLKGADAIFEYPMVDKDPIERWTFGRITFAGDAAHPMYPRGSNGSAQALIDVRTLAGELARTADRIEALTAYETDRRPATTKVVETNRSAPPDYINIVVEELTGDRPFDNLDDYISQDQLRSLSDQYKQVAGFSLDAVRAG